MTRSIVPTIVVFIAVSLTVSHCRAQKEALYKSISNRKAETWSVALDIWSWAEPGYQEEKSSSRLAKLLGDAGFEIQLHVADIPTAFTAQFGSGKPVIGILGEFDALPGLSQAAVPFRQPRE